MKMTSSVASFALALASVACGGGGGGGPGGAAPVPATVNPVVAWANAQTGSGTCFSSAVAVHSKGWSVVVGSMDTQISMDASGSNTLAAPTGTYTGFVARYEADGKLGWMTRLECDSPCTAYSVAIMTDDTVAVCGYFEGKLTLRKGTKRAPAIELTSTDGEDGFVTNLNGSDGYVNWGVRIGGKSATQALGVAPLSSGSCAVGGLFVYEASFYTDDATGTQEGSTLYASNVVDGFVLKYDSKGSLQWATSTQGTENNGDGNGFSAVWSVATSPANNDAIVIAGSFADTLTFSADSNGNKFSSTQDASGVDTADVFLAGINPKDGYVLWAQVCGGSGYDETYAVAMDQNDGSIRLTGGFTGSAIFNGTDEITASSTAENAFVAMFKSDGSYVWVRQSVGPDDNAGAGGTAFSAAIDSNGGTVLIGWFVGSLSFDGGSTTITNNDSRDIFLARYDIDGNFDWAKVEPGTGMNAALGCAILTADDTIWVCGYYHESLTLIGTDNGDGTTNDTTLSGDSGVMDGFLARFDDDGSV